MFLAIARSVAFSLTSFCRSHWPMSSVQNRSRGCSCSALSRLESSQNLLPSRPQRRFLVLTQPAPPAPLIDAARIAQNGLDSSIRHPNPALGTRALLRVIPAATPLGPDKRLAVSMVYHSPLDFLLPTHVESPLSLDVLLETSPDSAAVSRVLSFSAKLSFASNLHRS